ncbi:MAG: hypothetical protein HXX20_01570 [Chloroflexi bacterium]|nr:hypothetical protein [Chloroflexota bacterium]
MSLTVRQRTALTDGLADAFRNVEQLEDIVWRVEIHPDQPAPNPSSIIRKNPTLPQAIKDVIDYFDSCNRIAALITVALGEVVENQKLKDAQALCNEQFVTQVKDPRPVGNPDSPKASRRKDLEDQLNSAYKVLFELEKIKIFSSDPREVMRTEQNIKPLKENIQEIEEELRTLSIPDNLPKKLLVTQFKRLDQELKDDFLAKLDFIKLLLACPSMESRTHRNNLLKGVRKGELVARIARNETDTIDVENIVNTLLNYAGALEELISLVLRAEAGSTCSVELQDFLANLGNR